MSEELKQLITWFENYQVTFNEIRLRGIGIIRPLQVIY